MSSLSWGPVRSTRHLSLELELKVSARPLENVIRRDRLVVLAALAAITGLAWVYIAYLAWDMQHMGMQHMDMEHMEMEMDMPMEMAMPQMQAWRPVEYLLMFVMWAVMMVGMMVPSAAPMVLMFTSVNRRRREQQRPYVPTGVFLAGYLAVWTAFSALATVAQGALHKAALLSPSMVSTSPVVGGVLLLAAGIFQWTPLKYACLHHCRSPLSVITREWREGTRGAFIMGLRHGMYCTGCCWFLMALLFVAGVMNLLWIAAIAAFVLVEKVVPAGHWVARVAGVLLVVAGALMIGGYLD